MLIVILAIFIPLFVFWMVGLMKANDFSVPRKVFPSTVNNVLLIFPHADDEALAAGGSISNLAPSGVKVTWVILTQGERGNEGAHLDEKLKETRKAEAEKVAKIFKVNQLIQKDFPDNGVVEHREKLEKYIEDLLKEVQPDLVITYDQAGLYGHPDHIVISEVVTNFILNNYPSTKLWYASYPRKILDSVSLPEHMANDKKYADKRAYPTHSVWVGLKGVLNKIRAVYAYESQKMSYVNMMPVKQIPLWFYISLTPLEYYHEVN